MALVDRGEILEARIEVEGTVPPGTILAARLRNVGANGRNALAEADDGSQYLLPAGAPGTTQGGTLTIEVTRGPIPGPEPWKLPLARATDQLPATVQSSGEREVRTLHLPAPRDELAEAGWDELLEQARSGTVQFRGGELHIFVTPAMTLIDVDGYLSASELALAGASEAARAIRRLDIGGSIGVDLPTVASKATRQAA